MKNLFGCILLIVVSLFISSCGDPQVLIIKDDTGNVYSANNEDNITPEVGQYISIIKVCGGCDWIYTGHNWLQSDEIRSIFGDREVRLGEIIKVIPGN